MSDLLIEKIDAYIARDKNNNLYIGKEKPSKYKFRGVWLGYNLAIPLSNDLFPNVKWDDENPVHVEVIIKPMN